MSLRDGLIARGRAAAEAGMVDTCTIRRPNGEAMDPVSGDMTTDYDDLYVGQKCRVQSNQAFAEETNAGEAQLFLQRAEVQLPMTVVGLKVGDEVTITAAVRDPDLVGRVFQIRDLSHKTDATARRVQVRERTS